MYTQIVPISTYKIVREKIDKNRDITVFTPSQLVSVLRYFLLAYPLKKPLIIATIKRKVLILHLKPLFSFIINRYYDTICHIIIFFYNFNKKC